MRIFPEFVPDKADGEQRKNINQAADDGKMPGGQVMEMAVRLAPVHHQEQNGGAGSSGCPKAGEKGIHGHFFSLRGNGVGHVVVDHEPWSEDETRG